jgi:hypothetical protein
LVTKYAKQSFAARADFVLQIIGDYDGDPSQPSQKPSGMWQKLLVMNASGGDE